MKKLVQLFMNFKDKYWKLSLLWPLIGLIGGLGGIYTTTVNSFDRLFPPSIEIIELLPVHVWRTIKIGEIKDIHRGFSVILHLKNEAREVTITGLEISGKQKMTFSQWFSNSISDKYGRNIIDQDKIYEQKKPYYRVSWTGWMDDSRIPIKLEPYEERFIRFTIAEISSGAQMTLNDKYVGFDDSSRTPLLARTHAYASDFFESELGEVWKSFDISSDIKNENIKFHLKAGTRTIPIPFQKFKHFKSISEKAWNNKDAFRLFSEGER